jgi:predicted anti-sigma-YlaC factor YlaD
MEGITPMPPEQVPCNRAIELLGDLLEGALDRHTEQALRAHLAVCPPCVLFLEQLEQTRSLVGRLPEATELAPEVQDLLVREFQAFLSQ